MKHFDRRFAGRLFAVAVLGLTLAACKTVTIQNPFGGAPLVLTGNLGADLPGIKAYAADLKAGVKNDVAAARAAFQQYCPAVDDASTAVGTVTPGQVVNSTAGAISTTAASQKISQAQRAVGDAQLICNGGTATDIRTAFINFAKAATDVYNWIRQGKDAAS